ncbi:hypothetical protein [Streptomyces sp. NPDC001948]
MIADEAQDGVSDLAEGEVVVVLLQVGETLAGVGAIAEPEVGAQDVDAGLAKAVVGGVVCQAGERVDAAKSDGWGIGAEFVDGLGKALGVQPGGLAVGAGFVDALAAVGDDQGNECTGPGDHPEGKLHQVEERLRVELRGGVDLLEVQQDDQSVEDAARNQDRGDEGQDQGSADLPQPQLAFIQ